MLDLEIELMGLPISHNIKYTPDQTLGYVRINHIPVIIRIIEEGNIPSVDCYEKDWKLLDKNIKGSWVAKYKGSNPKYAIMVVARTVEEIQRVVSSGEFSGLELVGISVAREHSAFTNFVFSSNDGAKDSIIPIIWKVPSNSNGQYFQSIDLTDIVKRNVKDTGHCHEDIASAAKEIMDYLEDACPPIDIENEPRNNRYSFFNVDGETYVYNRNHKAYHGDQTVVRKAAPLLLNLSGFGERAYELLREEASGISVVCTEDISPIAHTEIEKKFEGRPAPSMPTVDKVGKTGNPLLDAALSGHPGFED